MILEIDNREPSIIKEYFENLNDKSNILFKNLEQGDFIIRDSNQNILLIIERKSIEDLLASVKDSRYSEQSNRYSQVGIPNNCIYYIIEGNMNRYSKSSAEYKTVYSCIFSLSYKKMFSVLQTINVQETINVIEHFYNKLGKETCKENGKENGKETGKESSKELVNEGGTNTLIKKPVVKKEDIDVYMLNLVPGIGFNTAKGILNNYNKSFYEFWKSLKNSEIDFENIKSYLC
jgi:ERCC4-type nuclease